MGFGVGDEQALQGSCRYGWCEERKRSGVRSGWDGWVDGYIDGRLVVRDGECLDFSWTLFCLLLL